MTRDLEHSRHARRLLRWYPSAWRERYGDEFTVHLEQEYAERAVDRKRSVNVAYKGLVARADELGLRDAGVGTVSRSRAALGTAFACAAILGVLALNDWSSAMLAWSSREYHPIPVDVTTGVLTAAIVLLALELLAVVAMTALSVIRQIARRRAERLIAPSIVALLSGVYVLFTLRWLPRAIATVSHVRPNGFRWIHPGPAAYGLAELARFVTESWVSAWNPGVVGSPWRAVTDDVAPFVVIVFVVAVAILVRRVETPRALERVSSTALVLFGVLSGTFLVTLIVWFNVNGPSAFPTFGTEGPVAGVAYLVFMALVTLLVARLVVVARAPSPRRGRNRIEIVGQ